MATAPVINISNWSGNQNFTFARVHRPKSIQDLVQVVTNATRVKVLGTGHSFNTSAAAAAGYEEETDLILMSDMPSIFILDEVNHTITVSAGLKFGDIFFWLSLHAPQYALHNSASLPHISVGGAIATSTHGSGVKSGNLASAVVALELVTANGEILSVSKSTHGSEFNGYVVHLGCLGIITRVTLSLVPSFNIRQDCYLDLDFKVALENIDEILSSGYSVSLFTTWSKPLFEQVWRKSVPENFNDTDDFFGAKKADRKIHPCDQSPECCTEQLGIPGPSFERLPHFKFEFQPSVGDELQSEFFVNKTDAADALNAVMTLSEEISPLLFITEIRSIASDDLWMSTAYGRETIAIHFTWKPLWKKVSALLPKIAERLESFKARPHWGKLFTNSSASISSCYPRITEFAALREKLDPQAKFANDFLREIGVVKHR
jgi:xylitol oxidase